MDTALKEAPDILIEISRMIVTGPLTSGVVDSFRSWGIPSKPTGKGVKSQGPFRNRWSGFSSSRNTFASFRSSVSKPSVNQP